MSTLTTPARDADANPSAGRRIPRIAETDARELYLNATIHELGRRAHEICESLHPEPYRTYVVDRNINYANWCTATCIFCDFKADVPGVNTRRNDLPPGYTLTYEQIGRKIEELLAIGGTQILMQGGLVPPDGPAGLPFAWYLDLMRFIKRHYPSVHVHAFSPPEIWALAQVFGMSVRDVLLRLHEAGLDTVPGGGGEILADRVRTRIAQGKTLTSEWLEVMRQAHAIGMKTSCTMMFGHIETFDERIEHLRLLRELQDESLARNNDGGFSAFICWPFQPGNTPLGRWKPLAADGKNRQNVETSSSQTLDPAAKRTGPLDRASRDAVTEAVEAGFDSPRRPLNDGNHLLLADAHEYLTMQALARIYLDNIPNVQASWVTMGPKIGQLALFFGANDMGSVMMEENVVSAAGTTYQLNEVDIRRLIADAGWQPRKRDYYYRPLE
ncbi:MAG: radical SAM protein [Phycisphaerae bacterium]|nr:radical SAM protein [Phycisphaerae bacterium]NUQ47520.1 radical SAM protein [Phycisphaerae bacterium]